MSPSRPAEPPSVKRQGWWARLRLLLSRTPHCARCHNDFLVRSSHKVAGLDAPFDRLLCTVCWDELGSTAERIPFYRKALSRKISYYRFKLDQDSPAYGHSFRLERPTDAIYKRAIADLEKQLGTLEGRLEGSELSQHD